MLGEHVVVRLKKAGAPSAPFLGLVTAVTADPSGARESMHSQVQICATTARRGAVLAVNAVRMFMNTCSRSLFMVPVQI